MNKLHKLALENLDKYLSGSADPEAIYLTEEEVRLFLQFANASDEEVENIINTLHDLALVTYELFCKEESLRTNAGKKEQEPVKSCETVRVLSLTPTKTSFDHKIIPSSKRKRRK